MIQATQQSSNQATQSRRPIHGGCVITAYRHYKGKKLGPYFFRKWKVGTKVYKQYIKPEDVEKIRAECAHSKQERMKCNRLIANFDWLCKMCLRLDRGKEPTPEQDEFVQRLHAEGFDIPGRPPVRPRRLFGAPIFSKLAEFLPSLAELEEIQRKWGAGAIKRILHEAFIAYHKKVFDEILEKAFPTTTQMATSTAMGWLSPNYGTS